MKQYIIDAFTDSPFSGNPAAVCIMDEWPADASMMKLARENNLSETAFLVKEKQGWHLRWFTPGTEVDLCGHATLASSFAVLNYIEPDQNEVHFHTRSGELIIRRKNGLYEMEFPVYEQEEIPVTDLMEQAFGTRPEKAYLGVDLVCVFDNEEAVRKMRPDQNLLVRLPGRIQNVTAKGKETDCVSRSFCPKLAITEDPVCGSAHCQIAPYWASVYEKNEIHAYQASARGGYLTCTVDGNQIKISGNAVIVAVSEILAVLQ